MKSGNSGNIATHKEVVVIGNGPSGIALSYMLSGNLPYVVSDGHPDELLAARLRPAVGRCLVEQDMGKLAAGLEGRSTNPVSLLLDALLHPYADVGLELEPLVEFQKSGVEIDHLVLGKGPPGGSWHRMDPHILTLSLGSWMALPGLPFNSRDSGEKRAYAHSVAKYYENYVQQMHLNKFFKNNTIVTHVEPLNQNKDVTSCCRCKCHLNRTNSSNNNNNNWVKKMEQENFEAVATEDPMEKKYSMISNALSCLLRTTNRKARCCKRPSNTVYDMSPRKLKSDTHSFAIPKMTKRDRKKSTSFCCDSSLYDVSGDENSSKTGVDVHKTPLLPTSRSLNFNRSVSVPYNNKVADRCSCCDVNSSWLVETTDVETGENTTYICKYLVLACGASDIPNRLELFTSKTDPEWLVHDVRSLEIKLDEYLERRKDEDKEHFDPVLVIGAGLSAADAIIATRARNIPVVHVFRSKSAEMHKQLPENMYPEYHKVYQMMKDGGTSYPLYNSYPEHSFVGFDDASRTVILRSKTGDDVKLNVSFAAVLIGARPDLSFLPKNCKIGVKKEAPIDCKTNTVNINKLTHQVEGHEGLFAIGPLAGDNFVRFIPGGALAVVSELYKQNGLVT